MIDSFVLKNLGLRLPRYGRVDARMSRIVELYDRIGQAFAEFLGTGVGRYLTRRFKE